MTTRILGGKGNRGRRSQKTSCRATTSRRPPTRYERSHTRKVNLCIIQVYIAGLTTSTNFPTTPGSIQPTFGRLRTDLEGFVVRIADAPSVTSTGIVNAATFLSGPVAPGEIISIFGSDIGPSEGFGAQLDDQGHVSTALVETQVFFDGIAAPLFFVRADQINAQVPYAVAGRDSTRLQVVYEGVPSNELSIPVAESAPGIFTHSDGSNRAVLVNQDGTINSPANPAKAGDIIVFFATGEGQTEPPGEEGKLAEEPFPQPVLPVSVFVNGFPADVLFAGSAPGFAGLLQINARVPELVRGAPDASLLLTVGGTRSQPGVTIAVE